MTLAHFTVWYKTVSGGEDDETEVTSGRLPRFQFQNGMGTIAQRSLIKSLLESASNDT